MKRRSPRITPWARALIALAFVPAMTSVTACEDPPPAEAQSLGATLELAAGEVALLDGEGSVARRVLSGTPLPVGAVLRTGAGARALVRLGDGTRVFLRDETTVSLDEGIALTAGHVWLEAPPLESGQKASAHTLGSTTVSLSDGGASLSHEGEQARVYVAEGLAIVTSAGGRSEVNAGEEATVDGQGAPQVAAVRFWDDWTGGMGDRRAGSQTGRAGSGSLYAVDRDAPAGSPALPLSVQRQAVQIAIEDEVAETRVDQHFFNPSSKDVEGWYWFTIPDGAQLVSFALETDGQLIEAEVVERKKAAATYEAAVERERDPALLEWIDANTMRARIYPVPPLGERRIVMRYQQLLSESENKLHYRYPMAGPPGKDAPTIEEFSLSVDLRGDLAKEFSVASLTEARVEGEGERVTMRRSGYTPRADFELELTRKDPADKSKASPIRVSEVDAGSDQARFVMVRYTPDADFDQVEVPRGDVVVVVDTSAAGDTSEYQTRLAVAEALLRSLNQGDRFAMMSADISAQVLYPDAELADATPDAISTALERVAEHGTGGATDLGAIFEKALERVHGLEQPAIVYIGDGLNTSGERGGDALAERLRRSFTGSRARLFTVGVGADVDVALLDRLARVGGGENLRVQLPEEAVVRALQLSGELKTPTITDLEVDVGSGLDDVFVNATGKLSRGQEFVLLARTHHEMPDEITVSGRLGGEDFKKTYEVDDGRSVVDSLVPRLWAQTYIERLMGDSRGPEAVRGKILSLGLEYGLMSPYSSFLALESEHAYARSGIERRNRRWPGPRLTADMMGMRGYEPDHGATVMSLFMAAATAPLGCGAAEDEAPSSVARAEPQEENGRVAKVSAEVAAERQAPGSPMDPNSASDDPAPPPAASPAPEPMPDKAISDDAKGSGSPRRAKSITKKRDEGSAIKLGGGSNALDGFGRGGGGGAEMDMEEEAGLDEYIATAETKSDKDGLLGGLTGDNEYAETPSAIEDATVRDGDFKTPDEKIAQAGKREVLNIPIRKNKVEEYRRKRKRRRMAVSHIVKNRQLPCSDLAARGLAHRRILWAQRLDSHTNMDGWLEVYEASVAACEVPGWKDQRVFLQLLQRRTQTERDVELLLTHFLDQHDAHQYVGRALLRRMVDPRLIATVENGLYGNYVDWWTIDRKMALETDDAKKLEILRAALTRAPGDPQGERRMIGFLVRTGKVDEAVAHGRRLRERGQLTPALVQQLGEVLVANDDKEAALRVFSEIVEFDPYSPHSRRLLGDILLRHGWYEESYRQYEDLLGLVAEDPTASIRLARAAAGAGRVDEGLRILRKVTAGEGRPGANDPRRWARLIAAAYLATLLADDEGPAAGVSRELKRLQLFDSASAWRILVWEDLEADLVIVEDKPEKPKSPKKPKKPEGDEQAFDAINALLDDSVDGRGVGLFAVPVPQRGLPKTKVRHRGPRLDRDVSYQEITVRFVDGKFTVERAEGKVSSREVRDGAKPDGAKPTEGTKDEGTKKKPD